LRSLQIEGEMAVPEASTVHGKVTMAQPAQRGSKAGAMGVEFFRLTLPEGKSYNIVGDLTSLRAEERKQILEEEGRVKGESSRKRNVIFIGGGAGAGAVIGAIAGGGKGAGIGAAAGAGLGALGALLSSGEEARVPEGTEIAMEFLRPVTVSPATQYHTGANDRTLYTSQALVRDAQRELAKRDYYKGTVDGLLGDETRRAIAHFQIDQRLPVTGNLDQATAKQLGLTRAETISSREGGQGSRQEPSQLASDLSRKAQSLLEDYAKTLGVRVSDLHSGSTALRRIPEWDLDLLLQTDSFVTAASWFEQAMRNSNDRQTAEANVLTRSARRVEEAMQKAGENREFSRQWANIESDLRGLDVRDISERQASRRVRR
jgi:hypothetical protein